MNTWLRFPLDSELTCAEAQDLMALHALCPLFIIRNDSVLGSLKNIGKLSLGEVKRKPSVEFNVSATHKSPLRILKI
jgi:hypothetical protein